MKRKHLFGIALFICALASCNANVKTIDKEVYHVVDSVEYHGIGYDNTLQTTPYWVIHFKDVDYSVRANRGCEVGDTIKVIERTVNKLEDGK